MTPYEVKVFLSDSWRKRKELVARYESMLELRSLAEKMTTTFSPVPSAPQGNTSRVEHYAIRIVEMEQDLDEIFNEMDRLHKEAERLIDLVDETNKRQILTNYHLRGMKASQAAEEAGYSVRHLFRLLNESYEEISKKTALNGIPKV